MASEDSSSTSTTPMILTPDSTGANDTAPTSLAALKKSRRQTAFYPNINSSNKPQKPFSRSAAKRESVMALGSIEHLQHYFTKTGIAAKQSASDKPRRGLVPAIGGAENIDTSATSANNLEFELPPSPAIPSIQQPQFVAHVKGYEADPESLLPGVVHDLNAVADAWNLPRAGSRTTKPEGPVDVLNTLKLTTKAIRAIRNYSVSLPDESPGMLRAQFRARSLGPDKPRPPVRPKAQPGQEDPLTSIRRHALEVLGVLRELEERARVPLNDAAYDAHSDSGESASRMASPSNSVTGLPPAGTIVNPDMLTTEHEAEAEASVSFSLVQVHGRYESVPVWEDEDEKFLDRDEETEKREGWDERLVLGSGWLYRQDITLGDIGREQEVVGRYLDVVDDVLFRSSKDMDGDEDGHSNGKAAQTRERGWERQARRFERRVRSKSKGRRVSTGEGEGRNVGLLGVDRGLGRRRVSTGMVDALGGLNISEEPADFRTMIEGIDEDEESLDEDELPPWAKRNEFLYSELDRAHAVLSAFLPHYLLASLSPSSSRSDFLYSLSSGQLLCVAYNACVRKSKFPWGFVDKDAIHDLLAMQKAAPDDEASRTEPWTGWTFRRSDNLMLWGGALRIRYLLPLQIPLHNEPSGGQPRGSRFQEPKEPPIVFDTKLIARREAGWEDMLETVLLRWVAKVVEERRHAA